MNAKNIVIGVIYRIPYAMKQVHMEHKLMYLIGDYNIDLSNLEKKIMFWLLNLRMSYIVTISSTDLPSHEHH